MIEFPPVDLSGWILWTAAIVAALGVIYTKGILPVWRKVLRPMWANLKRLHAFWEKLETIESHTVQLTNNGGSHLKDAIDRIEANQETHNKWSQSEFLKIWQTLAGATLVPGVGSVTRESEGK